MKTLTYKSFTKIKELGYDGIGLVQAIDKRSGDKLLKVRFSNEKSGLEVRPTQEMAAEWLREKKGVHIAVEALSKVLYFYTIYKLSVWGCEVIFRSLEGEYFESYDEALQEALETALDIVEERGGEW